MWACQRGMWRQTSNSSTWKERRKHMITIREERKEPDHYVIISAWILRHLMLNESLIHFYVATQRKQPAVYDPTVRSLLDQMRELKAHTDKREAVSHFQDRKGFTVQLVNSLMHGKAGDTVLPSRISRYRFPSYYSSGGVELWETWSSVSVLKNLCSSKSFPSQETFFLSSTTSLCWATLPPLFLL